MTKKSKVVFKKCNGFYRVYVDGWNLGTIIEEQYEWFFETFTFTIRANKKVLRKIAKKLKQLNGGNQ